MINKGAHKKKLVFLADAPGGGGGQPLPLKKCKLGKNFKASLNFKEKNVRFNYYPYERNMILACHTMKLSTMMTKLQIIPDSSNAGINCSDLTIPIFLFCIS